MDGSPHANASAGLRSRRSRGKRIYRSLSRRTSPDVATSDLKKRRTSGETVPTRDELSRFECCSRLQCFKHANLDFLHAQSKRVFMLPTKNRREELISLVSVNEGGRRFEFDGVVVCRRFLTLSFGFSNNLLSSVLASQSGAEQSIAIPRDREKPQAENVLLFLRRLAENVADAMPDTGHFHLPFSERLQVYNLFEEEQGRLVGARKQPDANRKIASYSYFCATWRDCAPHIKVRKVTRFTACTDCDFYKRELKKAGVDRTRTEDLLRMRREHIADVQAERREYSLNMDRALKHPDEAMSLILDGADQSSFGLPHFLNSTKNTRGESLRVHLLGSLEHGVEKRLSLFLMTAEHETGANHVIETLHRVLNARAKENGSLPPILYIQVDNCTRENKNRYFLAYCETLVAVGLFEKVQVSFLPIGHTHADIDQAFSRTAARLRSHEAITMEDLIGELELSYTPRPLVSRMRQVANISGLFEREKCLLRTPSFTQHRYFRLTRAMGRPRAPTELYRTSLSVRPNASAAWVKLRSDGSGFIKFAPDVLRTPPTETRAPINAREVQKRFQSETERIASRAKLRDLESLFHEVYGGRKYSLHWDSRSAVERVGGIKNVTESPIETRGESSRLQNDTESDEEHVYDFVYKPGWHVAVRTDIDACPFWIAEVLEEHLNSADVAHRLTVRWYEIAKTPSKGLSDCFVAKYVPATVRDAKSQRKKPYINRISTSSILVTFARLTRQGRIPVPVANRIRSSLISNESVNVLP